MVVLNGNSTYLITSINILIILLVVIHQILIPNNIVHYTTTTDDRRFDMKPSRSRNSHI